jgi:hypothetical protein
MSKHTPANQWRILFTVRPGVQIGSEKFFVSTFRSDESLANARLIAAAPQLLEALQDTFAMLETSLLRDTFGREWVEKARAAIATATQDTGAAS